jgi:hypothetical protein
MPTYVCSVPAGSLTIAQKTAVAEAIARIHSEATGAPQFFEIRCRLPAPDGAAYAGI